jgi:oligoendopeptidase F
VFCAHTKPSIKPHASIHSHSRLITREVYLSLQVQLPLRGGNYGNKKPAALGYERCLSEFRLTEFERDFRSFVRAIDELEGLFENARIDRTDQPLDVNTAVAIFEAVIPQYNALMEFGHTIEAYIYSFIATDSRDEYAQMRMSEMEREEVRLAKLSTRLTAWAGSQDVEALIERSEMARQHAYWLRRAKVYAEHMMSPAEESLATEMSLTGSNAWSKFYGNLSSQIMVELELKGERRRSR